ncbi:MAG: hypothetical protein ACR2MD_00520 [Aridibacter sp.]
MFYNRKNNPGCNFSEEIVSYLYDDFDGSDKKTFEDHLAYCNNCADELAGIGFVRSMIQDWKGLEFSNLPTPKIEIEFERNNNQMQTLTIDKQKANWLDKLNNLLSPFVIKTATGFAAIAILFGLGWFIFNSLQYNQTIETTNKTREENIIAEGKKIKEQILSSEKAAVNDKKPEIQPSNTNIVEQNESFMTSVESPIRKKQFVNNSNAAKNVGQKKSSTTTVDNNNRKVDRKLKLNTPNLQQQIPVQVEQKPSLTEFAVEDTNEFEIRLSDIFDEIGSDD